MADEQCDNWLLIIPRPEKLKLENEYTIWQNSLTQGQLTGFFWSCFNHIPWSSPAHWICSIVKGNWHEVWCDEESQMFLTDLQKASKWTFSHYYQGQIFCFNVNEENISVILFLQHKASFYLNIPRATKSPEQKTMIDNMCSSQKRKKTLLRWRMPVRGMFHISGNLLL